MEESQLSMPNNQESNGTSTWIIVLVVILALIVIIFVVILIVYLATNNTPDSPRPPNPDCLLPPIPNNVTAVKFNSYITISWSAVFGADFYNIYYKINDTNVSPTSYNNVSKTSSTSITYNNLDTSQSIYFIVTAVNNCGQGAPSKTVSIVPPVVYMTPSVPDPLPNPPTVTLVSNNCYYEKRSNTVDINFSYSNIPDGSYILQGTGQHSNIDNYLYVVPGYSSDPAHNVALKCGGIQSSHTVTTISKTIQATILDHSLENNTCTLTWKALEDVDQYVVFVASQDKYGNYHHTGTFTADTTASVEITANDSLIFGLVLGYNQSDLNGPSDPTIFITE
jgi:hypothetical protein